MPGYPGQETRKTDCTRLSMLYYGSDHLSQETYQSQTYVPQWKHTLFYGPQWRQVLELPIVCQVAQGQTGQCLRAECTDKGAVGLGA